MEITYLLNSGFLLRDGRTLLVFDDFEDPCHDVDSALSCKGYDRLYIFASHAHFDHFGTNIAAYADRVSRYIFSSDIRRTKRARVFPQELVVYMEKYEEWEDGSIRVRSFDSTDVGTSFLVMTPGGHSIFHAGDFNWWHWEGDTRENQLLARNAFNKQMKRLDGLEADVAFFPVDGRLGASSDMGAREFVARTGVRSLVTMHSVGFPKWQPSEDFFSKRRIPVWTPMQPGESVSWDGTSFR